MTGPALLVLRAEPGASATARRASSAGFTAILAPLFSAHAALWDTPPADAFDSLLLTSAHAARLGGPGLALYRALPAYAVGEATASAARAAGIDVVRIGTGDAAAIVEQAALDRRRAMLHLCGREHRAVERPGLSIERRIVYAVEAAGALPDTARDALARGAVAAIHSPRAGAVFASLVDERARIRLVAISQAALAAAGDGWGAARAADRPDDMALLAEAARLCEG